MPIPLAIAALIAAGIKGGVAIAKGIKARRDKKKGESQMNKALDDIKYTRPEEYKDIMNLLKQRKSSIPSRREDAENRIETQTAASATGIGQIADSPVAALGAYSGLKQREQQAVAGIGLEYEGIRDKAILGEAEGLKMGAGFSEKEDYYNNMYKNMVKANMGANRMSAGISGGYQAMEDFGAMGIDFLGTMYQGGREDATAAAADPSTDPTTNASLADL